MDVTVDTRALADALKLVKAGVSKKSTLQVLKGAKLSTALNGLTITTCDHDVTVRTTIAATIRTDGRAVIDHAALAKIIKGKGDVTLTLTNDEKVSVINGGTMMLPLLPVDEFPADNRFAGEGTVEKHELNLEALAPVLVAASTDDARPILCGVYFNGDEVVATDSYRLHRVIVAGGSYPLTLVPAKVLAAVAKHTKQATLVLKVVEKENWKKGVDRITVAAEIHCGPAKWNVRLIEGDFPNYRQLIPSSHPNRLIVERAALMVAVDQAKAVLPGHAPVRLEMTATNVRVYGGTEGEAQVSVDVPACYTGNELTVAFNPNFLLDTLKVGHGTSATIDTLDGLKPAMVLDAERIDNPSERLIMPVRVS